MTLLCFVAGIAMLLGCTFSINVNKISGDNSCIMQESLSPKGEISKGNFDNDASVNQECPPEHFI